MSINLNDVSNLMRYQFDRYERHIYIQTAKQVWQVESSLKNVFGKCKKNETSTLIASQLDIT